MLLARRTFMLVAMLGAMFLSVATATAQEVRYFVLQSSGLFEIMSTSTGGRFVIAPTSEHINVPGIGLRQVRGRTDRASNAETVVIQVRGSGVAAVAVTSQPTGGSLQTIFSQTVGLPLVVPRTVFASMSNLTVTVSQNGRTISRRLPVGSRP